MKNRDYIKQKGKSFEATELGIKVIKFLKDAEVCFVDIKFTAELESLLDQIQEDKITKLEVLQKFWNRLKEDIERGKILKKQNEVSEYKCPKCDGFLLKKHSKFGEIFSCQNYKKPSKKKGDTSTEGCSYTAKIGPDGSPMEKVKKEIEYTDFVCIAPGCGAGSCA